MSSSDKPKRLGRGLEALLGAVQAAQSAAPVAPATANPAANSATAASAPPAPNPAGDFRRLPLAQIRANPYQPRQEFRPEELADLEASLKASGLLQPITVRPAPNGDGFELVAGERRFRAAGRLGWNDIPAHVRDIDDTTLLTLALVENLQRSNLNPIEEADGYKRLIDEFGFTQQQVADAVGKDRSTVANLLRVLSLPAGIRQMVKEGKLTMGHARALLAIPDERAVVHLAKLAASEELSVREVERRAREWGSPLAGTPAKPVPKSAVSNVGANAAANAELRRITDTLRRRLQTDVSVTDNGGGRGEIRITFFSHDDLDRVLGIIVPGADD